MKKKSQNSIQLTVRQHSELMRIKREMVELREIDPFSAYNPKSKELGFFTDFMNYVDGKSKLYQRLRMFAQRIEMREILNPK